jgi:hypothetical protein
MKTKTLIRISGMVLLAVAVSLIMLALVYALQHPHLMVAIATIGWNHQAISRAFRERSLERLLISPSLHICKPIT